MSVRIFIENATTQSFLLRDTDNNNFGLIQANQRFALPLNFSDTFEKQYNLIFTNSNAFLSFWLNINSEISRVAVYTQPYTLLIGNETLLRPQLFNKLLITPQSNTFARAPPILAPPVPDGVLRLDFRG
jgi:hypothetical protein